LHRQGCVLCSVVLRHAWLLQTCEQATPKWWPSGWACLQGVHSHCTYILMAVVCGGAWLWCLSLHTCTWCTPSCSSWLSVGVAAEGLVF